MHDIHQLTSQVLFSLRQCLQEQLVPFLYWLQENLDEVDFSEIKSQFDFENVGLKVHPLGPVHSNQLYPNELRELPESPSDRPLPGKEPSVRDKTLQEHMGASTDARLENAFQTSRLRTLFPGPDRGQSGARRLPIDASEPPVGAPALCSELPRDFIVKLFYYFNASNCWVGGCSLCL